MKIKKRYALPFGSCITQTYIHVSDELFSYYALQSYIQFHFMIQNFYSKVKYKDVTIICSNPSPSATGARPPARESLLKNPFPGGKIETYFCIKKVFLNIHSTSIIPCKNIP